MNLHEAVARYRTLVLEGPDGLDRSGLTAALAENGFLVTRPERTLHHVDPTQPYRELLAGAGRIALDGSIIRELVYGPLRRGRSRVTWIQAVDFAEAVAERDGALLHVTPLPRARPPSGADAPDAGRAPASDPVTAEDRDALIAYARAFGTLAQHVPVLTAQAPQGPARRRAARPGLARVRTRPRPTAAAVHNQPGRQRS